MTITSCVSSRQSLPSGPALWPPKSKVWARCSNWNCMTHSFDLALGRFFFNEIFTNKTNSNKPVVGVWMRTTVSTAKSGQIQKVQNTENTADFLHSTYGHLNRFLPSFQGWGRDSCPWTLFKDTVSYKTAASPASVSPTEANLLFTREKYFWW